RWTGRVAGGPTAGRRDVMTTDPKLQYVLDRIEIEDVLRRYATAMDTGEMELFDDIFTEDAVCDYTQSGGPKTSYPELRDWLVEGMKRFTHWQHLLSNLVVTVDGDRATARTDVF